MLLKSISQIWIRICQKVLKTKQKWTENKIAKELCPKTDW